MSLLRLHAQPQAAIRQAYAQLIPPRLCEHLAQVDASLSGGPTNPKAFAIAIPPQRADVSLRLPAQRHDGDFALSMDLVEAGAGQLELSFIVINDLTAPRFNIDVDELGRVTLLGTAGRNVGEELRAMRAGLGPAQVRPGLRLFDELLPRLERLAHELGYVSLVLEPLTYHNAVMYERHGFSYIVGHRRMVEIDREFQPGGKLANLLDGRSPFRDPALAASARGRSWAIHDGILQDFDGTDHLDLRMVRVIGRDVWQQTVT